MDISVIHEGRSIPYRLIPASESWVRRLWIVRLFAPMATTWMTYRMPGDECATVTYPDDTPDPQHHWVVGHEECHVIDLYKYGLAIMCLLNFVVPLPAFLSGRWFVERWPYLKVDIVGGHRTVDEAVDALWSKYVWCWPKFLMRRWFNAQLKKFKGE
jgi:hypothetical protein